LTSPLHHANQLYLHLPAFGGFVAGQVSAGEEIQRQARLAEARAIYRDTVEVVAEVKEPFAVAPIRPEPDRRGRWRRRPGGRRGRQAARPEPPERFEVELVVDLRV
jgi:hypothetical protein